MYSNVETIQAIPHPTPRSNKQKYKTMIYHRSLEPQNNPLKERHEDGAAEGGGRGLK